MNGVLIHYRDINIDRFWIKVQKEANNICWPWLGGRDKDGYGYFCVAGASRKAHRVSYIIAHGILNPLFDVCHTCDNPSCVNPIHLWAGTSRANIDDMLQKDRSLHGIRNPKARLTAAYARKILSLVNAGLLQKNVAACIGCNQGTVSAIATGRQWSADTKQCRVLGRRRGSRHPRARLTEDTARQIMKMYSRNSPAEIARALELPYPTVYSVISGQTWSHITGINQ